MLWRRLHGRLPGNVPVPRLPQNIIAMTEDTSRTPTGHQQDTSRTTTGHRQDNNRTPAGHQQDNKRTPAAGPQCSEDAETDFHAACKAVSAPSSMATTKRCVCSLNSRYLFPVFAPSSKNCDKNPPCKNTCN